MTARDASIKGDGRVTVSTVLGDCSTTFIVVEV